jgi:hypothetical protein
MHVSPDPPQADGKLFALAGRIPAGSKKKSSKVYDPPANPINLFELKRDIPS